MKCPASRTCGRMKCSLCRKPPHAYRWIPNIGTGELGERSPDRSGPMRARVFQSAFLGLRIGQSVKNSRNNPAGCTCTSCSDGGSCLNQTPNTKDQYSSWKTCYKQAWLRKVSGSLASGSLASGSIPCVPLGFKHNGI